MLFRLINVFATLLWLANALSGPKRVLFLIGSQDSTQFESSLHLRHDLLNQSRTVSSEFKIVVRLAHEVFDGPGHWNLLPVIPHLTTKRNSILRGNTKWLVWCEQNTHVNLQLLLTHLSQEDSNKRIYMGHALYDQEATIIHHFAFFKNPKWFPYPLLQSGVVFSVALLDRLATVLQQRAPSSRTEFSIDAAHELAGIIFENLRALRHNDGNNKGRLQAAEVSNMEAQSQGVAGAATTPKFVGAQKIILQRAPFICPQGKALLRDGNGGGGVEAATACAMYAKPMDLGACVQVPEKRAQIYFAIKTCQQFHKDRIAILKSTWTPFAKHKAYYSNVTDASVPSVSVGVPNTESGHCAKTLAIFKLALKDIELLNRQQHQQKAIRWLFLSDDDTLLSVSAVAEVLGCYDATGDVYLGERYGYRLRADDGFNYITGGGGIALSLPAVRKIVQHCSCPTATAPDDMVLGACLQTLRVPATHSARFHQARPMDYAPELLQINRPVSFHKFWQLDPQSVYERWFAAADRQMLLLEQQVTKALAAKPQQPARIPLNVSQHYCSAANEMQHNDLLVSAAGQEQLQRHAKDKHSEL